MGRRYLALLVLGAFLSLSASVEAKDRSVVRSLSEAIPVLPTGSVRTCTQEDLLGNWQLIRFDSPYQFRDPYAPYLLPHQVFQYSKDGAMKSAHSARPIAGSPDQVFDAIPLAMSYRMRLGGIVTLVKNGDDRVVETWRCAAVTGAQQDPDQQVAMKRGDLVMTLIGKQGQVVFVRHLRKVAA